MQSNTFSILPVSVLCLSIFNGCRESKPGDTDTDADTGTDTDADTGADTDADPNIGIQSLAAGMLGVSGPQNFIANAYLLPLFLSLDPNCPIVVETAGNLSITGNCTTDAGMSVTGSYSITETDTTITVGASDFCMSAVPGARYDSFCFDGEAVATQAEAEAEAEANSITGRMSTDCVPDLAACNVLLSGSGVTGFVFEGTSVSGSESGEYNDDGALMMNADSVEGVITLKGGIYEGVEGTLSGSAIKFAGDACQNEPISGSMIAEISGGTAVFSYDGATSCDQCFPWTWNGSDQEPVCNE